MTEGSAPDSPTLADQASKLYDLMAGYHVTHLVEIARELGVWDALAQNPGRISSELAGTLGIDAFYTDVLCRTAFSFGLLDRDGDGWRMAPHFDQILGNPESRRCTTGAHGGGQGLPAVRPAFPSRDDDLVSKPRRELHARGRRGLKRLPRIFLDVVLPRLPELDARLRPGARVLDVGCGGWAIVQIVERFPSSRCVGIDVEPYSVRLAQQLIAERNLTDRCEAREQSVDQVAEEASHTGSAESVRRSPPPAPQRLVPPPSRLLRQRAGA